MKQFTIDNDNNITVHATVQDAEAVANAEGFSTAAGLAKLADKWPANRLVEIWNSLPGASPIKKFTDRKTAVTRIWKVLQSLGELAAAQEPEAGPEAQRSVAEPAPESVEPASSEPSIPAEEPAGAEPTPTLAPEPSAEPVDASPQTPTPFDETVATVSAQAPAVAPTKPAATKKTTRVKKAPKGEPKAKTTREGSKTDTILSMMKRPGGASLKQIMEATSWQAHSVRGFVSGMLTKKMGLTVVSAKSESGERTYSIGS